MANRNIPERDIENLIEQKLNDKGYVYDFGNVNRNVYMQKPRSEEERVLLGSFRPDYMIYLNKHSARPDVILEIKKTEYEFKGYFHAGRGVCVDFGN